MPQWWCRVRYQWDLGSQSWYTVQTWFAPDPLWLASTGQGPEPDDWVIAAGNPPFRMAVTYRWSPNPTTGQNGWVTDSQSLSWHGGTWEDSQGQAF